MTRKVKIAVMAYDGNIPIPQASNVAQAVSLMTAVEQWHCSFSFRAGDSILPRARNAEVANFLADKDATDLVMIDSDTIISPQDLIKLLKYDADIIGAPYRTRNEPLVWASIRWLPQDVAPEPNGLLEVECLGTGILRMSRRALQIMWDADAEREYKDITCQPGKSRPLFWFEVDQENIWGEDMVFCRKWRALGGKCYTAPELQTSHIGKTDFQARLCNWLAEQPLNMCVDDIVTGTKTMVINKYNKEWIGQQPLITGVEQWEAPKEEIVPPPVALQLDEIERAVA